MPTAFLLASIDSIIFYHHSNVLLVKLTHLCCVCAATAATSLPNNGNRACDWMFYWHWAGDSRALGGDAAKKSDLRHHAGPIVCRRQALGCIAAQQPSCYACKYSSLIQTKPLLLCAGGSMYEGRLFELCSRNTLSSVDTAPHQNISLTFDLPVPPKK